MLLGRSSAGAADEQAREAHRLLLGSRLGSAASELRALRARSRAYLQHQSKAAGRVSADDTDLYLPAARAGEHQRTRLVVPRVAIGKGDLKWRRIPVETAPRYLERGTNRLDPEHPGARRPELDH